MTGDIHIFLGGGGGGREMGSLMTSSSSAGPIQISKFPEPCCGGLVMIGNGWMVAVFCVRSCVMCCLVVSGRVCVGGGGISLSIVGCWQAGVDLVVVEGFVAPAGWRGHSPAEGAGCLLLSALFL